MENNHHIGLDLVSGPPDSNNDCPQMVENKNIPSRIPNFKNLAEFRDAKFRNSFFYFKQKPTNKHAFLNNNKGKLIKYKNLCGLIRQYTIDKKLVTEDGFIICDDFLKTVCKTNIISFFELAKHFSSIIL